jgi:hypothetical protein
LPLDLGAKRGQLDQKNIICVVLATTQQAASTKRFELYFNQISPFA